MTESTPAGGLGLPSLTRERNRTFSEDSQCNSCDDENSSTAPSCRKKFESYPYHPLTQMNEDEPEG